jgi:cob(I)alamin adenosyltransferase
MAAMKIYTRTGDAGQTGLFGGARVRKDDVRVEAYGTVDETNAALGLARASGGLGDDVDAQLGHIQEDLFVVGAELACVPDKIDRLKMQLIGPDAATRLERLIDAAEDGLPPLTSFVLPGGTSSAAALHLARTVCRRAERAVLGLSDVRPDIVIYLNRLSDLLFVLARQANHRAGVADVPWQGRASP